MLRIMDTRLFSIQLHAGQCLRGIRFCWGDISSLTILIDICKPNQIWELLKQFKIADVDLDLNQVKCLDDPLPEILEPVLWRLCNDIQQLVHPHLDHALTSAV
ncbi:unnamed protein product [Calypogeia fissa]